MKRLLCVLLASLILISSMFAFASCESSDVDDNDEKEDVDDKKEDNSKKEPTVPDGYKMYDNGDIRFAYPEEWKVSNGSVVVISSENGGNNITVAYEGKSDFYDDLTAEKFMDTLGPQFSALGQKISNVKVTHPTNEMGVKLIKVSFKNTASGVTMTQTQYMIASGSRNYIVTVTEVQADTKLVNAVFNTLCESK